MADYLSDLLQIGGNQGNYTPIRWDGSGNATAIPVSGTNSVASAASGNDGWSWLTGGKNADGTSFNGVGGLAINGISSLLGALSSWNNYKLGKEYLQNSEDQFNKNFGMQQAVLKGNVKNKSYAGALARGKSEADAQAYASSKLSEYGLA